ncbi:protein kinase domain-containing protein [Amycolatopsis sacchari]|uniref:Protein kinase domain-containing protein n=1 Tax=Amycolatopsis sacchari TaxID=115433 RepID=A0A1I3M0Q6_9PSEU|nr:phosphotransferase [Amycolatopsis sacchari]SFI90548.1 Protein kinase domain-containing protein [Amycolatopsis sacchari]
MKLGETVNGYLVVSKPTNAGAGKCLWAFAEKDGQEYFVKEFLEPKRPKPDSMGSIEDKQRRYAECRRFEERHRRVASLLRADHPLAGNLVLTKDFFAEGTRYYKVTRRIRGEDRQPHELDSERQAIVLRTLADSLALLHEHGIVHGDLKPDNVLLYRPPRSDVYTAKLIDFDDAYPAGEPPDPDSIGGNPVYGAPEWLRYVRGDPGAELTQAADMFAFGLLIHTYLFGAPPAVPPGYDSAAAAVLAGEPLTWDPRLAGAPAGLLRALAHADPGQRPDITAAAAVLSRDGANRVRINLAGRTRVPPGSGRLRINLTGNGRRS